MHEMDACMHEMDGMDACMLGRAGGPQRGRMSLPASGFMAHGWMQVQRECPSMFALNETSHQ